MTQPENESEDTPIVLSDDQIAFMAAYFECNANATRAWMKLHPKVTYESAKALASAFLTNINLRAAIRKVWESRAMGAEEAIARMSAIAKADLQPFIRIDDDGFVYFNFADIDAQEYLFLIKKIKTKRERRVEGVGKDAEEWEGEWMEVELHDAYTALRDIAKMHGKIPDRHEITGKDGKELPAPIVQIYIPKNDRDSSS